VPFEIVACNVIIGFWSDIVPTGAIIAIVLVLYAYVDCFLPGVCRTHAFGTLGLRRCVLTFHPMALRIQPELVLTKTQCNQHDGRQMVR
jgi:hypothetical protein